MFFTDRPWISGAALVIIAVAGCGKTGPVVVPVEGVLLHKGQPVPNALMNFLPEKGRQSWAVTDAKGHFKVNYDRQQDGAVTGKHKVWIEYRASSPAEEGGPAAKGSSMSKELRDVFSRYSYENSKLQIEIKEATSDLKIELD